MVYLIILRASKFYMEKNSAFMFIYVLPGFFLEQKWDWKNLLKTQIKLLQSNVSFVTAEVWLIICSCSQIKEVNIIVYWNQHTYKIKTNELNIWLFHMFYI